MGWFAPLNPPLPAWPDARVWIIGASTGIGAATARALLGAGARVALSARSADKLHDGRGRQRARRWSSRSTSPIRRRWRPPWARIRAQWQGVDLVLIVAGTHQEVRAWELNEKDSRALLETNLHGVVNTAAAVLPGLLAQGHGALGIVSSVAGYRGLPKALIYGASKAALINFAETLYLDLHPKGLGVYLIMPGFVKTPLTDQQRVHDAASHLGGGGGREIVAGLRAGDFEIHFPRAFTRQAQVPAAAAVPAVLSADPQSHRPVKKSPLARALGIAGREGREPARGKGWTLPVFALGLCVGRALLQSGDARVARHVDAHRLRRRRPRRQIRVHALLRDEQRAERDTRRERSGRDEQREPAPTPQRIAGHRHADTRAKVRPVDMGARLDARRASGNGHAMNAALRRIERGIGG